MTTDNSGSKPRPTWRDETSSILTYLGSCAAESDNSGVVGGLGAAGVKAQGLDPGSTNPERGEPKLR